MTTHKMKKFCKISKYLEMYDNEIYQVFDDLCLFPLLRVRNRGVTFLRPTNSDFRKKLINATYSHSPETAVDMIKTLILLDFLPNVNSFKNNVIPNASKFKLEVDKVDGSKVVLKSGHVLEIDKDFTPLRQGDLAAVYKLSGAGELLNSKEHVSTDNNERKVDGGNAINDRKSLGEFVETAYQRGGSDKNIYRATMACLYKHAMHETPALCKYIVDTMCATERASFYVIVEPYAPTLSYPEFTGLINKTLLVKDAYPACVDVFNRGLEAARNELIKKVYPDRELSKNAVLLNDTIRKNILMQLNPHTLRRSILYAYDNDDKKFAKDAFTIYCFLSTREEERDPTYYKQCFCYVVKNIYRKPTEVTSITSTDVAFTMSIYGNLVKSDAFKYVPFLFGNGETEERAGYLHDMPLPTDLQSVFTIEQSNITSTQGGSDHSISSLKEFMGM